MAVTWRSGGLFFTLFKAVRSHDQLCLFVSAEKEEKRDYNVCQQVITPLHNGFILKSGLLNGNA